MPWNGSGVFSRLYNFVQQAAAGVKILALYQDNEWDNVVGGLNNCMTLDGQTTPTADITLGGFKLTNLANGVALTDAATVAQAGGQEWIPETNGLSWVSSTSFKLLGYDGRTRYPIGRRIKSTNTGGTAYSTVKTVSYSAPDTTVTVINDSTALDSGFTGLYYGLLNSTNISYLSPRSGVVAYASGSQALTANVITKVALDTAGLDLLSEFNTSTYRFTAKYAGLYQVNGAIRFNSTTTTVYCDSFIVANGLTAFPSGWAQNVGITPLIQIFQVSTLVYLAAGEYIELWCRAQGAGVTAGGVSGTYTTQMSIARFA